MSDVVVVIVNLNGRSHLERCLRSLMQQTYPSFEVVLVDNGSTDGSADWVASQYPHVIVVRNERNAGFAAANNQGIRITQSPYVVTLNNDTEIRPEWLASMVSAITSDAHTGMCASRILQASNPDLLDSAGIQVDWTGTAWNRGYGQRDSTLWRRRERVWGPSAAAALYRRAMLDQIGLFDEDFFAYYEDVDLAWRANRAGWHCEYVPDPPLLHVHSATLGLRSSRKQYLISRNKLWCVLKNYPTASLVLRAAGIAAADLGALAYQFVSGWGLGWSALQGRLDAWRRCRLMLHKRKLARTSPTT